LHIERGSIPQSKYALTSQFTHILSTGNNQRYKLAKLNKPHYLVVTQDINPNIWCF